MTLAEAPAAGPGAGAPAGAPPVPLVGGAASVELAAARGAILPAPRLLGVGLVAVALGVLATWVPEVLALLPAWLLAALIVTVYDIRSSARPGDLRVRRAHDAIFALGATNAVEVSVENRSARALRVAVRDEYPEEFAADARLLAWTVAPGETAALRYRLTPPRRGEYRFGRLNLRYPTRLGLFVRQLAYRTSREPRVPDTEPGGVRSEVTAAGRPAAPGWEADGPAAGLVRVYPNLREVAKYELLARKGLTQELGLRNARRLGEGTEFSRLRDYVPDDEFRRIDWKASARRGKLIAREYETERSQHVLVVLDVGRLMNVSIPPLLKLDWAVNAALMLSWVALGRGDHVAMLTFGAEVRAYLPPRRGRRHFRAMLELLYGVQPEMAEPDFDAAFRYLAIRNPKRSLVVVFTDLVDQEVSRVLVRYLVRLVPHHVAVCVVIDDPAMTALAEQPVGGPLDVYERAIARNTLADRRAALSQLQRSGVITIDTPADKLNAALINRYLELKARGAI